MMNTQSVNHPYIAQLAVEDYERAKRKAQWRSWLSRLTRQSNDLLSFDKIRHSLPIKTYHHRGLQAISLDRIVGSEGRFRDFDRAFFPRQAHTKDRWLSIDRAYYQDIPLPAVELFKIGEKYFVRDGNHRISVARIRGQKFIDAYVTEIEVSIN